MRVRILTAMLLGSLCVTSLSGCRQKQGERCQIDSDCENSDKEDGLYCELGGNPISVGGTCQSRKPTGDMTMTTMDLSTPPDLTAPPDMTAADLSDGGPMDGGG